MPLSTHLSPCPQPGPRLQRHTAPFASNQFMSNRPAQQVPAPFCPRGPSGSQQVTGKVGSTGEGYFHSGKQARPSRGGGGNGTSQEPQLSDKGPHSLLDTPRAWERRAVLPGSKRGSKTAPVSDKKLQAVPALLRCPPPSQGPVQSSLSLPPSLSLSHTHTHTHTRHSPLQHLQAQGDHCPDHCPGPSHLWPLGL